MIEAAKSIPFFLRGPDATRCYASDRQRWSIVEAKEGDDFVAKVILKKGWGRAETWKAFVLPLVMFTLFGAMCLAAGYFDPKNQQVGHFLIANVLISLLTLGIVALMLWLEIRCFQHQPRVALMYFTNQEFTVGDDDTRQSLPPGSIWQYTLHHPTPGTQGGSTVSELDLVVRDSGQVVTVHKLMAYQNNGCWPKAQQLSKLTGLPLKRIALQHDGTPFPAGVPHPLR